MHPRQMQRLDAGRWSGQGTVALQSRWLLKKLEALKLCFLPSKFASIFPEMSVATCSEMVGDVPLLAHDRWLLCETLCELPADCKNYVTHIGRAGSESGRCAVDTQYARASLCYLW